MQLQQQQDRASSQFKADIIITSPTPLQGVSMRFIQHFIKRHASHCAGQPTSDVFRRLIQPRASTQSYAQAIIQEDSPSQFRDVGDATVYVVHAWAAPLLDTLNAVLEATSRLQPSRKDMFIHIDVFCNNFNDESEIDLRLIRTHMSSIDHVFVVCQPWKSPLMCARAWCLWEVASASHVDLDIRLVFAPATRQEMMQSIASGDTIAWKSLRQHINHLTFKSAGAVDASVRNTLLVRFQYIDDVSYLYLFYFCQEQMHFAINTRYS